MRYLESALTLAALGFKVFPLVANGKTPLDKGWQRQATRDPDQIRLLWGPDPVLGWPRQWNIGISMEGFQDGRHLVAVDIDNKGRKKGDDDVLALELEGKFLPRTFEQHTPSGGRHLIYFSPNPLGNSGHRVARGIDTRGVGGYVAGAGSSIDGELYTAITEPIVEAPEWLLQLLATAEEKAPLLSSEAAAEVDADYALHRAVRYLKRDAPLAIEGDGGNQTTYQVAARLKDLGISCLHAWELMEEHWNPRCWPPWQPGELGAIVEHAFQYGKREAGEAAPEKDFEEIGEAPKTPIDRLNQEYAFILAGGGHHILWETTDAKGRFKLEHLNELSFHRKFASETWVTGDSKPEPITKLWMRSKKRRSYRGFCFQPGREVPVGYYNLWQGFAVEPAKTGSAAAKDALAMFLEHAKDNVCAGNEELFTWLMGYFGHLVQKPWEKPLTALVFRGEKGVGKNALIDRIGHLLGSHYLLASNRRYLVGNFNGHLENTLLFALDEAFWSGDKQSEGTLKDLITGRTHVIEHKGKEPYSVENCTRVVIIGNEEWLVPATHDERRFAFFDVGSARKQDTRYFQAMREGMEAGGYGLLLQHLLDLDLSALNFNQAPQTKGLLDQKHSSLDPFMGWWLQCLHDGEINGSEHRDWPAEIDRGSLRDAFHHCMKGRNLRWLPDDRKIGRQLRRCLPGVKVGKKVVDGLRENTYKLPTLAASRAQWEKHIGHTVDWEE